MRNKKFSLKALFLGLTFSLALGGGIYLSNQQEKETPVQAATHTENFDEHHYVGSYYSFVTSTGEGLNGTLRTCLTDNIRPAAWPTYSGTSSSNDLAHLLQKADEDPTNSSNMIYLYTRDSVKKNLASSWNREHVWPQSLSGNNWGTGKGGSDILHLRPTYNTTNSTRGNDKYGEFTGGKKREYNGIFYGYSSGDGYFMPLDSVKGDVARIIMYVWTAYKTYYSSMPAITNVFQSYDTLLKWHLEDKPDVMEGNRNDFAEESLQKNRNPFVDHPEYAWKIFGNECSPEILEQAKKTYPEEGIPSVKLSETNLKLGIINDKAELKATSSNGSKITWSNSDESIISISRTTTYSGEFIGVTSNAVGEAIITATATINDEEYSAKCYVTVVQEGTITISDTYKEVYVGDTSTLSATSSDKSNISWIKEDSSILEFEENLTPSGDIMTFHALKAGKCVVTARAIIDDFLVTADCLVVVKEKTGPGESDLLLLNFETAELYMNQHLVLSIYVKHNTDLKMDLTNDNIMMIKITDYKYIIIPKRIGNVIISISGIIENQECNASCLIIVDEAPETQVDTGSNHYHNL